MDLANFWALGKLFHLTEDSLGTRTKSDRMDVWHVITVFAVRKNELLLS